MPDDPIGRDARTPGQMPWAGWKQIAVRTWREAGQDNVGIIAAGVAFYGFLALVPMLGAIVLTYGLVAEPATVMRHMQGLTAIVPGEAANLIGEMLMNVVRGSDGKKGLALALALGLALFGARNGAGALITALNIAYEEEEKRGFVRLNLLALAMTAFAVVAAIVAIVAIAALGQLQNMVPAMPDAVAVIGKMASYLLLLAVGVAGTATIYRFGPSRSGARWMWLTPGSAFSAIGWLLLTLGFGIYVANFGSYDATYGSLGAVVVLLTWLYLSSYILMLGAELNAEFEHQTAADTTGGAPKPLGDRGAWVADHVAGGETENPRREETRDPPARAQSENSSGASFAKTYVAGRVAARAAQGAGFGKVGALSSGLAALGLTALRRGPGPAKGAGLLIAAAAIAWIGRERRRPAGRIKAVLFDIDGTLIDSNGLHVDAWHQVFREAGYDISRDAIAAHIGMGGDLLVPALLPEIGKGEQKKLAAAHGDLYRSDYIERAQPFSGARELLRHARDEGLRVMLASSASTSEVDRYIAMLDAKGLIDGVASADEAAHSKPYPDIFAAALKKAGVRANEAIVVGDTPYDVQAAAACGIDAVAVRSGGFSDDLLSGAIALYDDVAALRAGYEGSPLAG